MRHKGAGMWKEKCNVVVLMLSWRCVYVQRNGQETGGPVFVALTEASKLESAMVCVAERMLFRHPKRQPGLRPSTGLCVWWAIGRLWGHVFPCLVANIPFTVFDSTSPCDFSGKKYERNQSANKLRVLSQREREKKKEKKKRKTWATLDFDRIFMRSLTKICIVIADNWRCFYLVVHFLRNM